jgi:Tol biopolymer transport system component/DNA-binding winged helix-turn-helix (wHTH) protein
MEDSDHSGRILRFGPFEADLETGELRKDGTKLALQVQPFQVLTILLKHSGELVRREQLRSQIWPEDTFVDFDHALNTTITKIRLTLGDNAEHPMFIETLPRRGYRFIGAVQKPGRNSISAADANATSRKRKALWIAAMSVGAVVVLFSAAAFWRTSRKPDQTPLSSLEVVPLLALHGAQASPAFSPDGNQVAFGEYEGEDAAIYTALIGGDKPLRLTVKSGVCCPTWSPDNRQIAFMRFLRNGFSINVVSALGGDEKSLYTSESGGVRSMCAHLDWSPDGKWLAFGESKKLDRSRIALLSLDDLTVRPLTSPEEQEYDCEPAFSPDGLRMAFERGSLGGFGKDLFVIPATGGEPHRLTFDNAWGGAPAWTQNGSDIVFSSMRGGPLNLWRVSATGGPPRPVAGVSALAYHSTIPRKGNLLAFEHASLSSGIWQIRLNDKGHSQGPPVRLITSRGMINWRPSFSPDGKKVIFESDRLGYSDIWYCDRDGSNCTQLTSLRGTAGTARWSPDGHHVVFEFQSQHYYDIYVVDVPAGRPRLLPTFPKSDNGAPNWSHDGKWIYFYSSHENGPFQLWKVPFQGGTPLRVTKNGGVYAIESEDGRSIYYSKLEQPGVWKMPLNGTEEERVLDQPEGYNWFNWALSPTGLYFLNPTGLDKGKIEFFDFATRKRIPIGDVEKSTHGLALAPDGHSLLYSRTESEDYDIMLVKNFR